ncbi:MAG: flavodoxin domain-containing protein [Pseudooceanicola sp.]
MKILITYGSTNGQTRRIARTAADWCADAGHVSELLPVGDADDIELGRFDAVIVAGSVHAGGYQKALGEFCAARASELAKVPNLFLSVSLTAAGHDADDWKGMERILTEFTDATGWTPGRVEQVAGAYLPSQYDLFTRFIMRHILARKDPDADPAADKEYTDWAALKAMLAEWTTGISERETGAA